MIEHRLALRRSAGCCTMLPLGPEQTVSAPDALPDAASLIFAQSTAIPRRPWSRGAPVLLGRTRRCWGTVRYNYRTPTLA